MQDKYHRGFAYAIRDVLAWATSREGLRETMHKLQPAALGFGYWMGIAYIILVVLAVSPVGVLVLTEAAWTTLWSPILVVAYPYNAY